MMIMKTMLMMVTMILREVVKKPGYFMVRLTVRVDPPPSYSQIFLIFLGV